MKIQLGPWRDQWFENLGIDDKIHHRQITPVRGEKRFEHEYEETAISKSPQIRPKAHGHIYMDAGSSESLPQQARRPYHSSTDGRASGTPSPRPGRGLR